MLRQVPTRLVIHRQNQGDDSSNVSLSYDIQPLFSSINAHVILIVLFLFKRKIEIEHHFQYSLYA